MPVIEFDSPLERLKKLHDIDGLSWRQIAQLPEYLGVPHGVIYNYAVMNIEPKNNKYRRLLGLSEVIEVPVLRDKKGRFKKKGKGANE